MSLALTIGLNQREILCDPLPICVYCFIAPLSDTFKTSPRYIKLMLRFHTSTAIFSMEEMNVGTVKQKES